MSATEVSPHPADETSSIDLSVGGSLVTNVQGAYMHNSSVQNYLGRVSMQSSIMEHPVDDLWACLLFRYFNFQSDYLMEHAFPHWREVTQGRNHALAIRHIHYVEEGQPKEICLIGDKRVTEERDTHGWLDVVDQLVDYIKTYPEETKYAIITVGHYVRFCEVRDKVPIALGYRDYPGQALHVENDEMMIDELLCFLVAMTEPLNA
ncbi:hypothetical protein E4U57_004853 [Claviceps arundinis]|uniref:Uncharacterized protein n=1 Tax=Claviceps arundinis TaxID=1623583 RepID=A0A9P7SLU1_9HYPO|nr:hypothetical protein E4U56_003188 [Claviceps arundinis]KAG5964828.1 hypothetical protein E4U57_004853 [Claviceps arundinis]